MTTAPVLVTGATGFIASRIVEQLLAAGYLVRGTVRSLKKPRDVDRLRTLPFAAERLELVEADLTHLGSFDTPAAGCGAVIHTASPYALTVNDPLTDLIGPALNGTRNVLAACAKTSTVKRVVLTSSMAAVTDEPDSARTLTEADWNAKSSLSRNPYYYSKTLAERAAWEFVAQEKPGFDLVAINPFMVIGPSLTVGAQYVEPDFRGPGERHVSRNHRADVGICRRPGRRGCARARAGRVRLHTAATSVRATRCRCAASSRCWQRMATRDTTCRSCRSTADSAAPSSGWQRSPRRRGSGRI